MQLGAFSVSLAVKDLAKSISFYEDLGFSHFGGTIEHGYAIMKNGESLKGLFQGMFENNMLTFNPGWDQKAQELESFTDVRDLQKAAKEQGLELLAEVDTGEVGPGHFMLQDPDGNAILIDQHV